MADEASGFGERDLAGVGYVYVWADGIHVNIRLGEEKLCLLVLIGGTGRRHQGAHRAGRRWRKLERYAVNRDVTVSGLLDYAAGVMPMAETSRTLSDTIRGQVTEKLRLL